MFKVLTNSNSCLGPTPEYLDKDTEDSGSDLSGRELVRSIKPMELEPGTTYHCSILRQESEREFWLRQAGTDQRVHQISHQLKMQFRW